MAYTAHKWMNGELITAERLNELEEAAAQAAQPGPEGKPGIGLIGEATELLPLEENADTPDILAKVNEIIAVLSARGVSKALEV